MHCATGEICMHDTQMMQSPSQSFFVLPECTSCTKIRNYTRIPVHRHPADPYVNRKPNKSDIIRGLHNEEGFCSEGRGDGYVDELHCDHETQYMFARVDELKELDDEEDDDE